MLFELPINVVVFGEHRIQSVGTFAFPLLPVPPSSACGGADYHTIYLHCIIALKWKEFTLPSVSVRTEPLKRIKHTLLSPNPKGLEFFHREFELSCMLSRDLWKKKPSTWTVIGLGPDRVKQASGLPRASNRNLQTFHRSHQNLPTEST